MLDVGAAETEEHSSCPQGTSSLLAETDGRSRGSPQAWKVPGRGEACSRLSSPGVEEEPESQGGSSGLKLRTQGVLGRGCKMAGCR